MPLSYGVPLGLVILVFGAILLFVTRYKKMAKIVIGFGGAIAVLTIILIVLAANSNM